MKQRRKHRLSKFTYGIVITLALIALSLFLINADSAKPINQTSQAGAPKISGRVMSKSDVVNFPDSPLERDVCIASKNEFELLLQEMHDFQNGEINSIGLSISNTLINKHMLATTTSNQFSGRYMFEVPLGSYVICLAQIGQTSTYIEGCTKTDVVGDKDISLDLFLQFGWVSTFSHNRS